MELLWLPVTVWPSICGGAGPWPFVFVSSSVFLDVNMEHTRRFRGFVVRFGIASEQYSIQDGDAPPTSQSKPMHFFIFSKDSKIPLEQYHVFPLSWSLGSAVRDSLVASLYVKRPTTSKDMCRQGNNYPGSRIRPILSPRITSIYYPGFRHSFVDVQQHGRPSHVSRQLAYLSRFHFITYQQCTAPGQQFYYLICCPSTGREKNGPT